MDYAVLLYLIKQKYIILNLMVGIYTIMYYNLFRTRLLKNKSLAIVLSMCNPKIFIKLKKSSFRPLDKQK